MLVETGGDETEPVNGVFLVVEFDFATFEVAFVFFELGLLVIELVFVFIKVVRTPSTDFLIVFSSFEDVLSVLAPADFTS